MRCAHQRVREIGNVEASFREHRTLEVGSRRVPTSTTLSRTLSPFRIRPTRKAGRSSGPEDESPAFARPAADKERRFPQRLRKR